MGSPTKNGAAVRIAAMKKKPAVEARVQPTNIALPALIAASSNVSPKKVLEANAQIPHSAYRASVLRATAFRRNLF